jgi:hypothetical protein
MLQKVLQFVIKPFATVTKCRQLYKNTETASSIVQALLAAELSGASPASLEQII